MERVSVLMTVYNEAAFLEYAIRSILPHVDDLVIVEGAYQETIDLGASPRSTDGTIEIIDKYLYPSGSNVEVEKGEPHYEYWRDFPSHSVSNVHLISANEQTDKDQRNVGLEKIKELGNTNGWVWIVDGDEVYDPSAVSMVKVYAHTMEGQKRLPNVPGMLAAYFKSLTFVNDFHTYTEQEFPRLFRLTPECKFTNDNFMEWPEYGLTWMTNPLIMKLPYVRYHHYAFCKGKERFELKKKWWETRFKREFDYGWHINKVGEIDDENHEIYQYTGQHPAIMQDHPLYNA